MTSFGLGELLLVGLLILISFDVKHIAKIVRWARSWRSKIVAVQSDWKNQIEQLVADEEEGEKLDKSLTSKNDMRAWGNERASKLPSLIRHEASISIAHQFEPLEVYRNAKVVAAYSSLPDEIDSAPLLQKILEDKKLLLLPYIYEGVMDFAPVRALAKDTAQGKLGILEPIEALRKKTLPPVDLYIVPGRCFDESGGRIGRGKGYYDKYFAQKNGLKIGCCYDVQISPKKLNLNPHDIKMDITVSEKKVIKHTEV